ncbi:MAG: hypothetical protein IJ500_00600 [Alphaproteobacteria bacterium]|nr:hypothetical protein [Alphaproteobacteria bacterium]
MSLPKSELSEILNAMGNVLTRLVDRVENDHEFQPYERRAILNTMYEKMCGVQMQEILDDANKSHNLVPKRGDGAVNDAYTGVPGEITVDMDAKTVRVHDGETTGGVAMARVTDVNGDWVVESQLPTAENNYTWYRKYKSGWIEMGGMIPKNAGTTSVITNFPLSFSITPNVILTKVIDTAVTEQNSIVVRTVSLDKFTINKLTTNNAVYWYACGISA